MERQDLSLSCIIRKLERESPERWKEGSSEYSIELDGFYVTIWRITTFVGLFNRRKDNHYLKICGSRHWEADSIFYSEEGDKIKPLYDSVDRKYKEYKCKKDEEVWESVRKEREEKLDKLGRIFNQ